MKTRVLVLITVLAAMLAVSQRSAKATNHDPVVYEAEIRFHTGYVENAGTDDMVYVSLRSNNLTRLDHIGNDWQRGSNKKWYGLLLTGVDRLSDISRIEIGKTGSDGWCIQGIDVKINGQFLYREQFSGSRCRWLDNGGGHSTTYIISAITFQNILDNVPPSQFTTRDIESMIQTATGNYLGQSSYYWSDRGSITMWTEHDKALHIELKMRDSRDNSTNPTIDVSYDLLIDCPNNRITVSVINPELKTGRSIGFAQGYIESSNRPIMEVTAAHLQDIMRRHTAGCNNIFVQTKRGPELHLGSAGR